MTNLLLGAQSGYAGPAALGRGLRPFFLLGAIYAVVGIALWISMLTGRLDLPTAFDPIAWHVHEMLFGFVLAVIAGFLLTAVPNWTGRPPAQGGGLAALVALWMAGRVAVAWSAIDPLLAAGIDLLFPLALLAVLTRDALASGSRASSFLPLLALAVFATANLLSHVAALDLLPEFAQAAQRLGLSVVVLLVALIGGRVVPAFTGNWLEARGEGRPPAMGRLDRGALMVTAVALLAWVFAPAPWAGPLLALAAAGLGLRLARWRGHRTLAEPLVWILHLAYLWLPVGLALLAAAELRPGLLPASAALHALSAGAIATMILAMMTRATLGHTGRPLHADWLTCLLYLFVLGGAGARVAASLLPSAFLPLIGTAGALWIAAFAGFALRFGPMLVTPRVDGGAP